MWQEKIFKLVHQIQRIGSLICRYMQKMLVFAVFGMFVFFSYLYIDDLFFSNAILYSNFNIQSPNPHIHLTYHTVSINVKLFYLGLGLLFLYNLTYNYVMAYRVGPGYPLNIHQLTLHQFQVNKKCKKCFGSKPIRTHHCSICNKCVLQMDHHCPWLGTCIGHYNRRFFIKFLTYLTFVCLLFLSLIIDLKLQKGDTFMFMTSLSLVIGLFTIAHWIFALRGVTTLQLCQIADGYKPSKSICTNFQIIFGTRNVLLALLPYYFPLNYYGCEWNRSQYNRVNANEIDQGNSTNDGL